METEKLLVTRNCPRLELGCRGSEPTFAILRKRNLAIFRLNGQRLSLFGNFLCEKPLCMLAGFGREPMPNAG